MSFILDALKKSENDRQRQSGPALFEVRVAPPRSRFPSWAIALVALLVVNLAVIGWLMFRRPAAAATPPMQASAAPVTQSAPVQSAPLQQSGGQPGYPQAAQSPQAQSAQMQSAPAQGTPMGQPPPASAANYGPAAYGPNASGNGQNVQGPPQGQGPAPTLGQAPYGNSNASNSYEPQRADERSANAQGNPDDYAPAAEPTGAPPLGHVRRGLDNGLMTYEEAASKNTIPPLRMDLHVYAPDPRQRFVLVNMKRLHEGESLPEGVKVDSITTDGVILSYRGVQFMMERD